MKKSLITLTVMLTAVALVIVFCGPAAAKVTGVCSGCHTMHNSEDGSALAGGPRATLLTNDCVGCHSHTGSNTTYTIGGCTVPVVNSASEPAYDTDILAGGNFYWVAQLDGDAKGHNVLGISDVDGNLSKAPGNTQGGLCETAGCHGSLARENTHVPELGSGCEGCHLRVRHHADDRGDSVTGGYKVTTEEQGWYRFLAAHSGNHVKPFGVHGIEDVDWQQLSKASVSKHNEYRGSAGGNETYTTLNNAQNPTVTAFCCGCHGEFHIQDESGSWIRHPSDAVIPNTAGSEYANAFGANGTGTGDYDPLVPVARPSLSVVSPTVAIGSDMVMCLSCHRPHGSPYDDLLRWDYKGEMIAGTTTHAGEGCFICHTNKDGL